MELSNIAKLIENNQNIALSSHINPDGDALGSVFALEHALKKLGKNVQIYLDNSIPKIYTEFFDEKLVKHDGFKENEIDLFLSLDISTLDRLGTCIELNDHAKITANIDHHISNEGIAPYYFVKVDASATAEIIYDLIKLLGVELDDYISRCLYIGILTDTGGFKHSNTTSNSMLVVAELMKYNIDTAKIYREVFDVTSYEKLMLLREALDSLEIFADGKIAVMNITREQLQKLGCTYEECDGIIYYARNIKDVEISILITEKEENEFKVSLRANYYANVADISVLFNGGGHARAAGFTVFTDKNDFNCKTLLDVKQLIVKEASKKIK